MIIGVNLPDAIRVGPRRRKTPSWSARGNAGRSWSSCTRRS